MPADSGNTTVLVYDLFFSTAGLNARNLLRI